MWCFLAGSVDDALPYIHTTYFTLVGNLPQVIYPYAWVIYPYAWVIYPYAWILYPGNLPPYVDALTVARVHSPSC